MTLFLIAQPLSVCDIYRGCFRFWRKHQWKKNRNPNDTKHTTFHLVHFFFCMHTYDDAKLSLWKSRKDTFWFLFLSLSLSLASTWCLTGSYTPCVLFLFAKKDTTQSREVLKLKTCSVKEKCVEAVGGKLYI